MINTGVLKRNPFPGCRPFLSSEDQLFFGRDKAVSDVIDMLVKRRFVAMVGASASGKTSLIQAGVIPALLADMKREWVPVFIRPGKRPMESLIRGIQRVFSKDISESDVHSFLNSSQSVAEFLKEKGLTNYYFFFVVDQFEELFTWPVVLKKRKSGKNPDAVHFINHLMRLVSEKELRTYLMLSIRAEFLDYCSNFRELTEYLNRSKYLLPRMSVNDLKESILEPLQLAGASVESGLEEYLLKDMDELGPALPLLQHSLKQTWNHWKSRGNTNLSVSLEDYQSTGGMRIALGRDLENLYQSLEFYQKEICERIFKSIAFKTERQEAFGRRTSLGSIARIAQCKVERVIEVVEIFDKAGHPFLGYQQSAPLSSETWIELAHESLINIWDRLRQWVDEEDESIRMYLKLSKASAVYQQGKGVLLEGDELQKALDWKEQHNPSPAWGIQFNPAFERAMVFLNTSEEEYIWNEKRKILQARRKRILNRSIFFGTIVVAGAIALIIYISRNRPVETDQQIEPLAQEELSTRPVTPPARANQNNADRQPDPAEALEPEQEQETRDQEALNQEALNRESRQELMASEDESRTVDEETLSGGSGGDESTPEETTVSAEDSRNVPADPGSSISRESEIIIAIARDASYMSLGISRDPELQGLVAYQSFLLNREHGGSAYDPDIYKGLYEALKKLISPAYNIYPSLRKSVKAMEWLNRSGSILMASSDGTMKILSGNIADRASQINLAGTGLNNECLGISPDERIAAVGTNGGGMLFIELENRGEVIHQNTDQGNVILDIENLGRSGSFLSIGNDGRVLKWDYSSFAPQTLVEMVTRPVSLATSTNGSRAAIGTSSGRIYLLNVNDPEGLHEVNSFGGNQARALDFSPDDRYLAAGMRDGSVKVLSANGRNVIANLFGPGARVSAIEFSPDGRFLVAASNDGNVYLWNALNWEDPPVVFTENNGFVLSLCFSRNGRFFYTGSVDYPRMVGRPTDSDQMASDFCSLLSRNLTREEWNQYYGQDLPYQETCPR
jgi:WD40 repeat protein